MYDALRKAEAENKKAAGLDVKGPGNTNPEVFVDKPNNNMTIVLVIAVIAVFAIVFLRVKSLMGGPKPSTAIHTAMANTAQMPQAPVSAPVKVRAPGTYGLDGVIDAGDNSMAIINGKLLKVEGTIDALILKKITPKQVELLNTKDNSTVILNIQQ